MVNLPEGGMDGGAFQLSFSASWQQPCRALWGRGLKELVQLLEIWGKAQWPVLSADPPHFGAQDPWTRRAFFSRVDSISNQSPLAFWGGFGLYLVVSLLTEMESV